MLITAGYCQALPGTAYFIKSAYYVKSNNKLYFSCLTELNLENALMQKLKEQEII